MNKSILVAAMAMTLLPSVHAQTAPASTSALSNLSVNGTLDLETQYIYRGKKVTNSALQPSANINWGNVAGGTVTAYAWSSQPIGRAGASAVAIDGAAGPNENNEIDLGIKYDNTVPSYSTISYEIGFQMYWYPNYSGQTNWLSRSYEGHIGFGYDTTDLMSQLGVGKYNVSPMLTYFHDFIMDSNTLNLTVATYTFDLSDATQVKGLSLTPTFNIGWTGIQRSFGDQLVAGAPNWANSFLYWELDLELDWKPSGTGTTTFFTGVHYAGNNDGTTGTGGLTTAGNPQNTGTAGGSDANIWFGFGIKFNQ